MFNFVKKNSGSVILVEGFLLNNRVRTEHCKDCVSSAKVIVGNLSNPNLVLFGCNSQKCRQNLIRLEIVEENENQNMIVPSNEIFLETYIQAKIRSQ